MPFDSYKSASDVAHRHHLAWVRETLVGAVPFAVSDHVRDDMTFSMRAIPFDRSEAGACEVLIFPLLREVWKPYRDALTLWSHEPIAFDEDLCGVPDYLVSRRSPLSAFVPDQPFLLVVEAKRDDFFKGWGQCLAAMRAAQKLSGLDDAEFWGISTSGRAWEFGRLVGDVFVQELAAKSIDDLDGLASTLDYVMIRCCEQAARLPAEVA